ncbi:hypothetical protein D3C81_2259040 [compost metagenome]
MDAAQLAGGGFTQGQAGEVALAANDGRIKVHGVVVDRWQRFDGVFRLHVGLQISRLSVLG